MNVKLIVISSIAITIVLVAAGYFLLAPREEPISNKPYYQLKKETLTADEAPEIERFEYTENKDVQSIERKFSEIESPEEKVRATDKALPPED